MTRIFPTFDQLLRMAQIAVEDTPAGEEPTFDVIYPFPIESPHLIVPVVTAAGLRALTGKAVLRMVHPEPRTLVRFRSVDVLGVARARDRANRGWRDR
jgi:hypothetical protein